MGDDTHSPSRTNEVGTRVGRESLKRMGGGTCLLAGGIILLAASGALAAADRVKIAVLPVVVHSSESRQYLRDGIADMMSSRLEQVKQLEVIRVDDESLATNRASEAIAEGRKLGADYVLYGSFTRFGEGASLDVQCVAVAEDEAGAPVRRIFVQSGHIGSLIPDLDDLVGRITRFAVEDFDVRGTEEEPASGEPRRAGLADLRARVQALEEALRQQGINVPAPRPGPSSSSRSGPEGAEASRMAGR